MRRAALALVAAMAALPACGVKAPPRPSGAARVPTTTTTGSPSGTPKIDDVFLPPPSPPTTP